MSKQLKLAIESNDAVAVQSALKTVKDINRKLPGSATPLLLACECGSDKVIESLLKAGAVPESPNALPEDTAFGRAAKHGHLGVLGSLLEANAASAGNIEQAVESAVMEARETVVRFVLEQGRIKATTKLLRLATYPNSISLVKLLLGHGVDINACEQGAAGNDGTVLHFAAGSGDEVSIKILLECGANANSRDAIGQTPLMALAGQLDWRIRKSSVAACQAAVEALLRGGADATAVDCHGNDALAYYEFEARRDGAKPHRDLAQTLRDAGAVGLGATFLLVEAIGENSAVKARKAIGLGADVNRISPPPCGVTPLVMASGSTELVELLLGAGADPNMPGYHSLPLVAAVGSGNFEAVKLLLKAGAHLHAVEPLHEGDPLGINAYLRAKMDQHTELLEYLIALGAGLPKPAKVNHIEPGVPNWNDFSELLVKGSPQAVADALAGLVSGQAYTKALGKTFHPGVTSFVVVRPKGLAWSHVFRVSPAADRFEDTEAATRQALQLHQATNSPVLSIMYSDTSDAVSLRRWGLGATDPNDDGCDHESLRELVEAMGKGAPAWARKRLAETCEGDPPSTERLDQLAKRENFVAGAFNIACEADGRLVVEFPGFTLEQFEDAVFVTT
ncbi:MAG: hypothetical protein FD161_261 [Limisphaerales bacterium]|nr:MAG: hypothetical protein FD161_261 [Limisphaerales bacterium]KAG0510707.1 MAG: hypothetical protein E1N63_261 [Limisphaerales bacterium]TXT52603.1 MAG: hypothetical protein FD140_523 [Limisphaerales bacterium]